MHLIRRFVVHHRWVLLWVVQYFDEHVERVKIHTTSKNSPRYYTTNVKRGTAFSLPKARYKYQNQDNKIVQVYVFFTALLARKRVQCHTCMIVYRISCWVGEGTVRNSTPSPTDSFRFLMTSVSLNEFVYVETAVLQTLTTCCLHTPLNTTRVYDFWARHLYYIKGMHILQ